MNSDSAFVQQQYELAYPDGIENHWWHLARNKLLVNILNKYIPEEKIIEVGAGRGLVVQALNDSGFDCYGVELAEVVIDDLIDKRVFSGTKAEDLPQDFRESFTVLMLLDVIEHIESPESFLNSLLASYPNIKHIIITVPAGEKLWSNYDEYYGHYRRYTLNMLASLSEGIGARVNDSGYFLHSIYLVARGLSFFSRKRSLSMKAPSMLLSSFHKIIASLMAADFFLLPKNIKGTSAYAYMSLE